MNQVYSHNFPNIIKGNKCDKSHDIRYCMSCCCKHYATQNLWYVPPTFPFYINNSQINGYTVSSLYQSITTNYGRTNMSIIRLLEQTQINSNGNTIPLDVIENKVYYDNSKEINLNKRDYLEFALNRKYYYNVRNNLILRMYKFYKNKPSLDKTPNGISLLQWRMLIYDLYCLRAQKMHLNVDNKVYVRLYADKILHSQYTINTLNKPPLQNGLNDYDLNKLAKHWDKIIFNIDFDENLIMWQNILSIIGDYRLPFLHDPTLYEKIQHLYALRSLYLLILSTTIQENIYSKLLGHKDIIMVIAGYFIGY
jgi:hypothetical protein